MIDNFNSYRLAQAGEVDIKLKEAGVLLEDVQICKMQGYVNCFGKQCKLMPVAKPKY